MMRLNPMRTRTTKWSPGRWTLERERFHLEANRPQPTPDRASKLSDLISGFMKEVGLEGKMWQQALISEWPQLVGEQVARRARPGRIQNRVLTIFVTNSVWLNELSRYSRPQMLKNLQARFGVDLIRDIRLQPDPDLQKPGP
jgi:predicted nucleic acid-binding Zn ribbon protein